MGIGIVAGAAYIMWTQCLFNICKLGVVPEVQYQAPPPPPPPAPAPKPKSDLVKTLTTQKESKKKSSSSSLAYINNDRVSVR